MTTPAETNATTAMATAVNVAADARSDSEQQQVEQQAETIGATHADVSLSEFVHAHTSTASVTQLSDRKQHSDESSTKHDDSHNNNNNSSSNDSNNYNNDDGDNNSTDELHRCEYSAAQLRVKEQQARLEAKIAADEQMLALRKQVVELEHRVQELARANAQAGDRARHLQDGVDVIVAAHKRTLNGMRDNLELDALVAALETEKAAREKLHVMFATQNAELLAARARIESLSEHVRKYQKTETVLAQSVSHLQHRFESKDQQRVASLERVRAELAAAHARESQTLRHERDTAVRAEQLAQEQLLAAQKQLDAAHARSDVEQTLRERIASLETDNAVLVRKAEQLQRADAQLRSRVKSHEDTLVTEREHAAQLREEVKELTKIASDLMEMAEKHQQEKRAGPRDADAEFLATRKKRLRMSIG